MLTITKVLSSFIQSGFRKIKVRRYGNDDIQTPTQSAPFGVDSVPPKGMAALYAESNKKGKTILLGYINTNLFAAEGELRLFAVDENGEESNYFWIKANGDIEIGGSVDNMVRYSKLKEGFDQLKSDHDALVSAFNTHVHATAASGPPSVPTPGGGIPVSNTTADISDSKIEEIKTS